MASTRFTVLTGHLSQYSLADLIGILRHQRKTGRLLIEYIASPAVLFFKDGNLVDAQYNTLIGVQAIFVAFVQPPAAFNFNPLIQPTRDSIDFEQQRVILELLGCWTEDAILVQSTTTPRNEISPDIALRPELKRVEPQLVLASGPSFEASALHDAPAVLALPAATQNRARSLRSIRRPWVLALATFSLLLIFGVPTLIAINNKARKVSSTPTTSEMQGTVTEPTSPNSKIEDVTQVSSEDGAAISPVANEKKRETELVNQRPVESGQLPTNSQADTAVKEAAPVPAPVKDTTQPAPNANPPAQVAKAQQSATSGQTVKVVMKIENGRVVQATVGDRRPGAEAYEALALRIARQRRYPAGVNKQETLLMKVDGPK